MFYDDEKGNPVSLEFSINEPICSLTEITNLADLGIGTWVASNAGKNEMYNAESTEPITEAAC